MRKICEINIFMKHRLDELLVLHKLCSSRSQAKQHIESGCVFIDNIKITKPGKSFADDIHIEIKNAHQYVGRGALKLEKALEEFQINTHNIIAADIGASTGGFTDCLLQKGAQKVFAIDVGYNQLAEKLKNNQRVVNIEKTNIRDGVNLSEKVDLCVVDLSFISLTKVLDKIAELVKPNGHIITLFKPQFEAGPGVVDKHGIIKDESLHNKILDTFLSWCNEHNFYVEKHINSPIVGGDGNKEFLLLITRKELTKNV